MTIHADAAHDSALAVAFSPEDWDELNRDDVVSAKVVVGLMFGIFATGLVLYSIVAWVVAS